MNHFNIIHRLYYNRYSFPKEEQTVKEWLQILGIPVEGWKWTKNRVVCSEHFRHEDYLNGKRLMYKAVPSLNINTSLESSVCSSAPSRSRLDECHLETSATKESHTSTAKRHKRKIGKMGGSAASTSSATTSSSGSKKRRVSLIKSLHNYSISPSKLMRQNIELKKQQASYRRRLYRAKKTIRSLKNKVHHMKEVMEFLRQDQCISENAAHHLEKSFDSVPHLLMRRYLKNVENDTVTHENYPSALKEFAATLQFYSGKAYEEVRKRFAMALPHQATVRKWYKNVNCEPGFLLPAFDALESIVRNSSKQVICSLLLDEMSIRKQIDFDGHKTWGYVSVGVGTENDEMQVASEALVLLVVSHTGHWKMPVAYIFVSSLTSKEKANLVNETLIRLHDIGIDITSVTCDGPSVNFSMMKELGCNFDNVHELKTWFEHPVENSKRIYCVLDACHMLKLMRNNFASLEQFKDPNGEIINWKYIKKLHELQEQEGVHIANKLKRAHIEWFRQKMKVNLAAQTLSNSVADAIEFLSKTIKLEEFKGSEATVQFIRRMDSLFDVLNSRSPHCKGFKAPLRTSNEYIWRPFILETVSYLLRCTDVTGRPLFLTVKKTPFIGFCITALSVCGIFDDFVTSGKFSYFLTYKVSQDHLETLFCSIRSRNGWNNNPSCLQFMRTLRRLLLHTKISQDGGNCKVLDTTTILSVPSTSHICRVEVDVSNYRRYNFDPAHFPADHDFDLLHQVIHLDVLSTNVVTYISGYVIKMLKKIHKCDLCLFGTESPTDLVSEESYSLISFKNRGGLHVPSYGVVKICQNMEMAIRNMMVITENRVPSDENFLEVFVTIHSQKFYNQVDSLFPSLKDHFLNTSVIGGHHGFLLVKNIARSYFKIRIFNLCKKYTEKIQGPSIRRKLHHLILYSNQ